MTKIQPYLLGSGMAGQAILKSIELIKLIYPDLKISTPIILKRDQGLDNLVTEEASPILFIANPSALHTECILKAQKAGFKHIVCEKPLVTDLEQLNSLKDLKISVAALHGYRMMWGPQTIQKMIQNNELGELISIESRYWQSSVAQKALSKAPERAPWKADANLNGKYDVLLDLGSHWMDMITYLAGALPTKTQGNISFVNSADGKRDTHLNLNLKFSNNLYATGSISKTVHGYGNHFEINILGALKTVSWNFLNPDQIIIGEGANRNIISRKESTLGGKQNPFHGLGWIDGYIEICAAMMLEMTGVKSQYPSLQEILPKMEKLLTVDFQ